ncbi:hypothetical protein K470DRAFT_268517 [Piedraia hortae CBS 480.64]|uniref:DUF659 domain-containing protein n=1 Tax=Piedraia hortae CBS 480.64 TaxID=1314780 RepID=A0A6A7C623_9PEZI|nr:hypothetical protein K470DRAFT_268517 [Piedraia hortae CBS 480.64]
MLKTSGKARNMCAWLRLIVMRCEPLCAVEDLLLRQAVRYDPIPRTSLTRYLMAVHAEVVQQVNSRLPNYFGIVFDGWTERRTHYLAIFAVYDAKSAASKLSMLAFTTFQDQTNLTADNNIHLLEKVLDDYTKSRSAIIFAIGDNCQTNQAIANRMCHPFIGCATHRQNLAVQDILDEYEADLRRINEIMVCRGKIKKMDELRKRTKLQPITRNATRWGSTYHTPKRFFKLELSIDKEGDELAAKLPNSETRLKLKGLMENTLSSLEQATKLLQGEDVSLAVARCIFDWVVKKLPQTELRLNNRTAVIVNPDFEDGTVKVLDGQAESLTSHQKQAVSIFRVGEPEADALDDDDLAPHLQLKRARKSRSSTYLNLSYIHATSKTCERVFCLARRIKIDYRKSMSDQTFEALMVLHANVDL